MSADLRLQPPEGPPPDGPPPDRPPLDGPVVARKHPAVVLDRSVRRLGPGLLLGGSPLRLVRLAPAAAAALDALLGTAPGEGVTTGDVPGNAGGGEAGARGGERGGAARRAADVVRARLCRSGLLHPLPAPCPLATGLVTVLIPARGRRALVRRALAGVPPGVPAIVADDASPEQLDLPGDRLDLTGREPPVVVLRREVRGGPGAARNTAARRATSEVLAFLDSDVSCPPGWLSGLLGHFADPDVVAVAPRVVSAPGSGLAGLVETARCALDLGADPAVVRPGSAVPFVPTATLLVRRTVFEAVGGFDESLRVGEDVELLRRLGERGVVRYEPRVTVLHAPRRRLSAVLRRRYRYGTSAALLDELDPGSVAHLDASVWGLAPLLVAAVHPLAGVALAGGLVAVAPRSLSRLGLPPATARSLAWRGQVAAARDVARFAVRPCLPLLCAACALRPLRRPALAAAAAGLLVEITPSGRLQTQPLRGLAAAFLDDLAYGSGVLAGCVTRRRTGPLRPRLRGLRRTIRPAKDGADGAGTSTSHTRGAR